MQDVDSILVKEPQAPEEWARRARRRLLRYLHLTTNCRFPHNEKPRSCRLHNVLQWQREHICEHALLPPGPVAACSEPQCAARSSVLPLPPAFAPLLLDEYHHSSRNLGNLPA
eukprot:scaffold118490_cov31-Tisochrysis_lutea.AAC.5